MEEERKRIIESLDDLCREIWKRFYERVLREGNHKVGRVIIASRDDLRKVLENMLISDEEVDFNFIENLLGDRRRAIDVIHVLSSCGVIIKEERFLTIKISRFVDGKMIIISKDKKKTTIFRPDYEGLSKYLNGNA